MKITVLLSSALLSLFLLQSCSKDSDDVGKSKEALLTQHTWKMEEITQVENNTQIYYKRGGSTNTNSFDNDKITFLAAGTGTYSPTPGETFNITWQFTNMEKTAMNIVITFSPTVITTLKCSELDLTGNRFFCVTSFTNASSQPVLSSVYRSPL